MDEAINYNKMHGISHLKEATNPEELTSQMSKPFSFNSVSFDVEDYYQNYKLHQNIFTKSELENQDHFTIVKGKNYLYFGGQNNDLKQGWGVLVVGGTIYEGQFQRDHKCGVGYQKQHKGKVYNGEFRNSVFQGNGTLENVDGSRYTGNFRNGLMEGEGMWVNEDGDKYIGQWSEGKATGRGVLMTSGNAKYEGEFKEFVKHGEGVETFENGDVFRGYFEGNTPNGYGEYYWANENNFKGVFRNGLKHGLGRWVNNNGDMFEGFYNNDKKCGAGEMRWANGDWYVGEFFNDRRHGKGEMHWANGASYRGVWQKGVQDGPGVSNVPGRGERKGIFKGNLMLQEEKTQLKEPSGLRRSRKLVTSKAKDSGYPINQRLKPIPQHTQRTQKKQFLSRPKPLERTRQRFFAPRHTCAQHSYKVVPYGYRDSSVSFGSRGFPIYIKPNLSLNSGPITVKVKIYQTGRGIGIKTRETRE